MPRRTLNAEEEALNVQDVLVSIEKKIAELNNEAIFYQNHQDAIASKLRNLNRAKTYITDNYQDK